jgi:hypothetical protein
MATKPSFGDFLQTLAEKADTPTADTLNSLKAEFQKEQQERIRNKLRDVFNEMSMTTERLRAHRQQEQVYKDRLAILNKRAEDIIAGKV